jgi:hypothetical protein
MKKKYFFTVIFVSFFLVFTGVGNSWIPPMNPQTAKKAFEIIALKNKIHEALASGKHITAQKHLRHIKYLYQQTKTDLPQEIVWLEKETDWLAVMKNLVYTYELIDQKQYLLAETALNVVENTLITHLKFSPEAAKQRFSLKNLRIKINTGLMGQIKEDLPEAIKKEDAILADTIMNCLLAVEKYLKISGVWETEKVQKARLGLTEIKKSFILLLDKKMEERLNARLDALDPDIPKEKVDKILTEYRTEKNKHLNFERSRIGLPLIDPLNHL